MQLETVRIVAEFLRDPVHGLNAVIAQLPIEAGDDRPNVEAIADEFGNDALADAVASNRMPDGVDVIVSVEVNSVDEITGQISHDDRDYKPSLMIRAGVRNTHAAKAQIAASYIYRALVRCLHELHKNENENLRHRNGTYLLHCESLRIIPAIQSLEGSLATGGLIPTYQGRDYTLTP